MHAGYFGRWTISSASVLTKSALREALGVAIRRCSTKNACYDIIKPDKGISEWTNETRNRSGRDHLQGDAVIGKTSFFPKNVAILTEFATVG